MSWTGPMGMCGLCGFQCNSHKYTCKVCGKRLFILTNKHRDESVKSCVDCQAGCHSECPESLIDPENVAKWMIQGHPSIFTRNYNETT